MPNIPTANNNPGDIKDPTTGTFMKFKTPQEGYAALLNDLHTKQSGASSTGLTPTSTLVDFAKVYAPSSDKNNPGQYAANLANQMGVRPDAQIKDLDLGKWADAVAHNEGYQGKANAPTGYNPTPYSNPTDGQDTGSINTANASIGDASKPPEGLLQKAGDVAGAVGNFLFPIVGDIGADIQGKSDKSALQQTGDAALSALPFIPGLGEAGEAVKGADLVADAAPGLLSKLAGSTVAKGAAVGYGAGVASNLSQGQSIGQSVMPNANTITGGLLGGAAPIALKGLSAATKGLSGVSEQVVNALRDSGISTDDYNSYISAAKARAGNIRAPAPLELAANHLDDAADIIQKKTDAAGTVVGEAKKAASSVPLAPIDDVGSQFQQHVADKYGLDLKTNPATGKVVALPQTDSMRQVSPGDKSRIENIASQLNNLYSKDGTTVKNATEVMDNLNNLVDHSKADIYGHTNDPLEGLIKDTAGNLNKAVRKSSPALANANDAFSGLKGLQKEIKSMAGGSLNRGELLMKRVFSGDKSGDVQNLFGKIKDETGIDLVNHAVLAKHAIDVAGDASQKSLLQQMIEGGTSIAKGPLAALLHAGTTIAQKTIANPETIGREAVKGKAGLLKTFGRNIGTKSAIEGSRLLPGILGSSR